MGHSHAKLDEDHKCFAAKCPGVMVDPPETYGKWAYWWGNAKSNGTGKGGWHSKPNPRPTKKSGGTK